MTASEPSYQVLARTLRTRVRDGEFADGRQLPTEAQLAAEHALSRQTVRRAYQDLVAEGTVYRVRGRGTFAAQDSGGYVRQVGTVDDLMGLSEDTAMQVVEPLHRKVDPISAGRLRTPSDLIHELRFVRMHDGVRFCATTVHLPPDVARVLADVEELHTVDRVSTLTVIGLLDERLPFPITEAQQSITLDEISAADARSLGGEPGRPSLRIDRLYLDTNGDAVELAVSHFLPEHYSYRVRLLRSTDRRA